jgi:hypothetical protein
MNGAFVAEARRAYVPAAQWMRDNGWGHNLRNRPAGKSLEYSLGNDGWPPYINVSNRTEVGTLGRGCPLLTDVASLTQAIDHLVVAGILPANFGSWSAGYVQAIDSDGDTVWDVLLSDGTRAVAFWSGHAPVPTNWKPLYRKVVAS